jgi:hypothetical protein
MVKGVPEISHGVANDLIQQTWDGFDEFELVVLMVQSLYIRLDSAVVRASLFKPRDFPVKIYDVFLCAC